ncbi:hypothetical protein TVAG_208240 [Trichomonas vaginalis G3]|uniref:Uncharacterized protein n=1 Tax=Trichomonas vaginalis (strain ATCC PRA-98 / G3) TaxID=412133 RepID=A2FZE7_TRIV3|nr:actin-binding protein, anillin/rhotekin family [Trichomonas vaginalis G3]EAX89721.1 hypothetical protein TVAG_208240 [Trichomonas vaginalis G3]KAI5548414.1 actin-binding protein, anillin/rhotekin family [Trichomonas vaginalis G3]|eukprot:XP_001302651.1 hypothetical protein [Trichomonas vaginalis G3]
MSESPVKRHRISKTTSETGETHRKRVKKSSSTEKTKNREVLRNKWKLLIAKKVRKARIRNVSDIEKYNRSYIHFYKSKTKMAFKKWKLKFEWRQLLHEILFKYRIDNIHKEAEKTSIDSWERFYIELQREIKTQNIIAAFNERDNENLLEKCFSTWKNKIFFVNDLHKYYREKWFTLLEGLIDIDKEERQKLCLQAINYYENWKYFSQQLLHNSYIQSLTNAKNTVDLLHNWNYFALQLKLNQIKLIHESDKNRCLLRSKWISISNEMKYRNQIEVLEYQRNELNKSLKIYVLIDKIVKQTRTKAFLEARKELTDKTRRTLLTKSIRKWHIETASNRKVTQISRKCFQDSLSDYMVGVGSRNATKIKKWYKSVNEKRKLNKSLLSKCFIMWHKFIPRFMDTIFVTPMLNASLKIPEVFSTKIMPIKIPNNISVCKDIVSFRLKTRVYENNSFLNQNRKEVEKRFDEALKKDGLNVIDRFIPDDVAQIVSGIMKGFDFHYPTETDETKPKNFDLTEEFIKVLDNSDFFSDIFTQFSPRNRQELKQEYENSGSFSDDKYVFEYPPDASFSKREDDATELKTSKVNLDELSSSMDLSDQDDIGLDTQKLNLINPSNFVIEERSSSIITDMASDSEEEDKFDIKDLTFETEKQEDEDKDEMKKLIDEMTTETPTQETNEDNTIHNDEEEADSNQQTLDFNETVDKVQQPDETVPETIDNQEEEDQTIDNDKEQNQTIPESSNSSQNKIEEEEDEEDNFDLDLSYHLEDDKDLLMNNIEEEIDESIPQTIDSTKDEEIPQTIDNENVEEEEHQFIQQKQVNQEEEDAIIDNVDEYSDEENGNLPMSRNIKPIYNEEEEKPEQKNIKSEEEDFVIDDNENHQDNEIEEEEEDFVIDEEELIKKEKVTPKNQDNEVEEEEEEDFVIDEEEELIKKEKVTPKIQEHKIEEEEEEDFAIDTEEEKSQQEIPIDNQLQSQEEEDIPIDNSINEEEEKPEKMIPLSSNAMDLMELEEEEEEHDNSKAVLIPSKQHSSSSNEAEEESLDDFAKFMKGEAPQEKQNEEEEEKVEIPQIKLPNFTGLFTQFLPNEVSWMIIDTLYLMDTRILGFDETEETEEETSNEELEKSNEEEEENYGAEIEERNIDENEYNSEEENNDESKINVPFIEMPGLDEWLTRTYSSLVARFVPRVFWDLQPQYPLEINDEEILDTNDVMRWMSQSMNNSISNIVKLAQVNIIMNLNINPIDKEDLAFLNDEEEEEKTDKEYSSEYNSQEDQEPKEEESGDEYNDYSYIQTESPKNTIKSNEEESKSSENKKKVTFDFDTKTFEEELPDECNHFTITLDESFVRDVEEPMIIMQNLLEGTNRYSFLGSNSETLITTTTDKSSEKEEEKIEIPESFILSLDATIISIVNDSIQSPLSILSFQALTNEQEDRLANPELPTITAEPNSDSDEIVIRNQSPEDKPKVSSDQLNLPPKFFRQEKEFRAERFFRGGVVPEIRGTSSNAYSPKVCVPIRLGQGLTISKPIEAGNDIKTSDFNTSTTSENQKVKIEKPKKRSPKKKKENKKDKAEEQVVSEKVISDFDDNSKPVLISSASLPKPPSLPDIKNEEKPSHNFEFPQKFFDFLPQIINDAVNSSLDRHLNIVYVPLFIENSNNKKQNDSLPLLNKRNETTNDETIPLLSKKNNDTNDDIPLLSKRNNETTIEGTIPLLSKKNNDTNDDIPLLSKRNIETNDSIPLLSKRNDTNDDIPLLSKRNDETNDESIPLLSKKNNNYESIPLLSKRNDYTNESIPLLSKRNPDDDIPLLSKRRDITDDESIPLLSKRTEKPLFDVTNISKKFIQNQLDNSLKASINDAVSRSIPYPIMTNDISQSSKPNYVQMATKKVGNELDKSLNESINSTLNMIMKQIDFGLAEKIEKPSLIEKSLNEALTSAVNQSVINSIYQICFV